MVLQLSGEIIQCEDADNKQTALGPITLRRTRQGLLVTNDSRVREFGYAEPTISVMEQLNLADGDYTNYIEHEQFVQDTKIIWEARCRELQTQAQVMSKMSNTYFEMSDVSGQKIVVYANSGMLELRRCIEAKEVTILNKLNNCYEDVPVQLAEGTPRFLKDGKFIVNSSRVVNCDGWFRQYNVDDNLVLRVKGNEILVARIPKPSIYRLGNTHFSH